MENSRAWIAPAGIFLTLATTLIAADFRDVWFLRKDVSKAAFFIFLIASLIWLAITLFRARKSHSVEDVISDLKTHGVPYTIDRPAEHVVTSEGISVQSRTSTGS